MSKTIGPAWTGITFTAEWFAQDLRKFGHHLKWGNCKEMILEVGCANGFVTRKVTYPYLRDHLNKLLAIDKDEILLKLAKENNDIDNIEFRHMDIMDERRVEAMKLRFHKIFLPHVAHLIPDNRALLQRLRTLLKPNGQVFFTILLDSTMHHVVRATHKKWMKCVPEKYFFYDYTLEPEKYFSNLATQAGFQVHDCESQKGIETVEDITAMTKAGLSCNDKMDLIPPELLEEYVQDHIRKWQELSSNTVFYERMICVASKVD